MRRSREIAQILGLGAQHERDEVRRVARDVLVIHWPEASRLVVALNKRFRRLSAVASSHSGRLGNEIGAVEMDADTKSPPRLGLEVVVPAVSRRIQKLSVGHRWMLAPIRESASVR